MAVTSHDFHWLCVASGYVLPDRRFDWLVREYDVYQENLFQSTSKNLCLYSYLSIPLILSSMFFLYIFLVS